MGAGDYYNRVQWLTYVRTLDSATGEEVDSYAPNGYLWCAIEEQGGKREEDTGGLQTGAYASIRIRNYPNVSALDVLLDDDFRYVWHINSITVGSNELLADAYRNDTLEDVVIDDSN